MRPFPLKVTRSSGRVKVEVLAPMNGASNTVLIHKRIRGKLAVRPAFS